MLSGSWWRIRKEQLRVSAGGVMVRCELDPKAEISVRWHDVCWVRVGDKVQFTARYPAGRKGQAQAETMNITTTAPLDVAETPPRGHKKAETREQEKKDEAKKEEPKSDK